MVKYSLNGGCTMDLGSEIIIRKKSEFQEIVVLQNPTFGKIMLIGEEASGYTVQFTEKDEAFYHEAVVHPAMCLYENPKNILIIGGGDGGIAREVLKHNVEKITIVDIDKTVVDISKKYVPIHNGALDDPKVKVIIGDGKKFIEETNQNFDVILIDLTDPSGPSKFLFTKEFYSFCKKCLNKNGVLSLQTSSPVFEPQVLGRVNTTLKEIFKTVVPYSTFVPGFFVEESYCVATDSELKKVSCVINKRNIELNAYLPFHLDNVLEMKSPLVTKVLAKKWLVATVENPVDVWEGDNIL